MNITEQRESIVRVLKEAGIEGDITVALGPSSDEKPMELRFHVEIVLVDDEVDEAMVKIDEMYSKVPQVLNDSDLEVFSRGCSGHRFFDVPGHSIPRVGATWTVTSFT